MIEIFTGQKGKILLLVLTDVISSRTIRISNTLRSTTSDGVRFRNQARLTPWRMICKFRNWRIFWVLNVSAKYYRVHVIKYYDNESSIVQVEQPKSYNMQPANSTAMWIHHTKCSMTTRWRFTWIWFWNTSLNLVFTDKFTWTIRIPQTFRATAWDWVWHRKKTRFAPLCKFVLAINKLKTHNK